MGIEWLSQALQGSLQIPQVELKGYFILKNQATIGHLFILSSITMVFEKRFLYKHLVTAVEADSQSLLDRATTYQRRGF